MSKNTAFFLSALGVVIILALATFNFQSFLSTSQVLGIHTEIKTSAEQLFWEKLLQENPSYFPGWLELARIDKANGNPLKAFEDLNRARSINPNFEISLPQ